MSDEFCGRLPTAPWQPTRREYFATAALTGLLAQGAAVDVEETAIAIADTTMAALDADPGGGMVPVRKEHLAAYRSLAYRARQEIAFLKQGYHQLNGWENLEAPLARLPKED